MWCLWRLVSGVFTLTNPWHYTLVDIFKFNRVMGGSNQRLISTSLATHHSNPCFEYCFATSSKRWRNHFIKQVVSHRTLKPSSVKSTASKPSPAQSTASKPKTSKPAVKASSNEGGWDDGSWGDDGWGDSDVNQGKISFQLSLESASKSEERRSCQQRSIFSYAVSKGFQVVFRS